VGEIGLLSSSEPQSALTVKGNDVLIFSDGLKIFVNLDIVSKLGFDVCGLQATFQTNGNSKKLQIYTNIKLTP
jgi:hypothetical protein